MQVNSQNIQRPKLFDDFFDKELDYKNDYLAYINVTSNQNNNIIHKKAKSDLKPQSRNSALSLM